MYSYAITDPTYYAETPKELQESLENLLSKKSADFICFRDKTTSQYAFLAEIFLLACKKMNFKKSLLHGNVELSIKLGAYGVHLTSQQLNQITHAKSHGLFCVVSTHSEEEIVLAQKLGADAVTYSPIYATPDKGIPKGLQELKSIVSKFDIKIIALGGIIEDKQLLEIEKSGAYAFASIRYFYAKCT